MTSDENILKTCSIPNCQFLKRPEEALRELALRLLCDKMDENSPNFWIWGLGNSFPLNPIKNGENKEKPQHFACLDDGELDKFIKEAQAKKTKYAVNVFQVTFAFEY